MTVSVSPCVIPNLLIIAGTGNKSGKTTFACRLIEQFRDTGIIGIKITPHVHEISGGLRLLDEGDNYALFEESDAGTGKDTSRMLKAGAARVFYVAVKDGALLQALIHVLNYLPERTPVVCESPALRYHVEPGGLVIMKSSGSHNNKNINDLVLLPHVMFELDKISEIPKLPIEFINGKWNIHPFSG